MALSPAKLTTLRNAINAETDPTFVTYRTEGASQLMADWFNVAATPTENAWRKVCERATLDDRANYAIFDALSAGKRDAWSLFLAGAPRDMTKARNRNAVTDIWGLASTVGRNILTDSLRPISRAEKLLGGTATETTDTIVGLVLTWEGPLQASDIVDALA